MKAVIMAGGMGTRLRPVCPGIPKPMAPLLGRPLMEHIILLLKNNGITDICAALRYMPEAITSYFGDGGRFGVNLQYRIERSPLGTAGSVKNCEEFFRGEDVLVISGDAACDFDLSRLARDHMSKAPAVTLALYPHPEPLPYGLVLTDRSGRVVSFIEKPDWGRVVTDLVSTGIYIVSPRAVSLIPPDTEFDFAKDLFPLLMQKGETLRGISMEGYWCDIGTPRAYYQCNLDALDGDLQIIRDTGTVSSPGPFTRGIRCRDRARLMRALSENLMEAGADFSDGLTLLDGETHLHIAPSPDSSAIMIEVSGRDAESTAVKYQKLAESLIEK